MNTPSGPQPCSSSPIRMRFGIGGERGLAGAGEAEEQRDVTVLADIGRAVHRHHALRRQVEVERGEYRLLHLARIGRAADQHDLAGEIDRHHRVGALAAAVTLGVRLERRQVDDRHLGRERRELRAIGTDQELADEQRVPGVFGEHANLDAVFRIGAAEQVLREQLLAADVGAEIFQQVLEVLFALLAVAAPPDDVLGGGVDDGVLVLGRAAGVMPGLGAERTALHDVAFARRDGVLVERRRVQIPVDRGQILEAEFVSAECAVPQTSFLHERPPEYAGFRPSPEFLPAPLLRFGWRHYSPCPQGGRPIVRIWLSAKTRWHCRIVALHTLRAADPIICA